MIEYILRVQLHPSSLFTPVKEMKVSWSLCKAFLNLTLGLLEDYVIYQPDNINYLEIYSPVGNVIEQILFSFILASWEKKLKCL